MHLTTHKKYLALVILGALILVAMVIYVNAPSVQSADGVLDSSARPTVDTATYTATSSTNLSVVLHQSALNDLLEATGSLKGEGPLLFNSKVATFAWKAEQLRVQITDSGAIFTANVFVRGIGMNYQSPAQGAGTVEYDLDKEQIDLVLSDVPFDFRFKILGKRIKIATLNIANLVGPRIGILGNLPLHADFTVKKHVARSHLG